MAFAPPSRWQSDEVGTFWSQQQSQPRSTGLGGTGPSTVPQAGEVDTVNNAWKHVKGVVVNDGKAADLYDLLLQTGKETTEPMPAGWPSLLKPKSPMLAKMPSMVMQRYHACQSVCFCGVFPPINRVWATVDNSLFLWRFDKWNDVPLEYSNEEQAICAVGLMKPKFGVFPEAVQYVLVICTASEIVLLGVCCSAGNSADPTNELELVSLPGYSISSDNVSMCCVAATPDGRIFIGGSDGNLSEVLYNSTDTWLQKRCYKRDLSRGVSAYLPGFVPRMWHKPSPILDIVIDNDRHILYTRSQNSSIQVYDLGADGRDATVRRVAEMGDILQLATQAAGGDIFRGRSPADRKGATIVHLAAIPPGTSQKLHLLAVTQDGRRVYFTTMPSQGYSAPAPKRPTGIKAVFARQAPPQPAASAARGTASSKGLETTVALYSQCMLLLSDVAQEGRSKLLIAARDMTIPPLGTSMGTSSRSEGLREAVGELEMLVPGETCAIQAMAHEQPPLAFGGQVSSDELAAQTITPPPRFVLVTTAGVLELEKRRPVDILQQMLEERSNNKLEQFFKSYGAAEVAAMCFLLVTSPPADASANVLQQARSALENTNLTGLPQIRSDLGAENVPPHTGFDMGQAVPVAEPEWSGAHKGLCMYVARLLQPVWEEAVMAPLQGNAAILSCRLPTATLQAFESRLRSLEGFLRDYQQRRRTRSLGSRSPSLYGDPTASGRSMMEQPGTSTPAHSGMQPNKRPRLEEAAKQEDQRVAWIRGLVERGAEACFLLRILSEHHMPRLTSRLDDATRGRLQPLRLRDWVCSSEGEAVAAQLISVLVTEHLTATGGVAEDLAGVLQQGCPSYFKEDDKTFYQASGMLQRAEAASAAADREALGNEALKLMMQVPLACDLGQVVPQLASLRNFSGCVELPLRKAAALDPGNMASSSGPEGRAAREARYESCYIHVMQVLKFLIDPGVAEGSGATVQQQARMSDADRNAARRTLLQRAAEATDPYFHKVLYDTLIDARAIKELLDLDGPHLEEHLRSHGGLPASPPNGPVGPLSASQVQHLELLAKLYIKRMAYENAAGVYQVLASRRSGVADQAVSLAQRQEAYQNAVLQAKGSGNAELVDQLDVRRRIVELQQRLIAELRGQAASLPSGSGEQGTIQDVVAELEEEPKELSQMYNDYATPHRLWPLALEMVALANFNDAAYIRQLWDVYLRQAWDAKQAELGSASAEQRAEAAFEEMCTCVERLGIQLFPNDTVFPAPHVCLRLELAACGIWPERGPAMQDRGRVASAMLKACNLREDEVLQVYNALLSQRGGEEASEQLHMPIVRLRLLRSQLVLLRPLVDKTRERQPGLALGPLHGQHRREIGILIEACEMYSTEAGRLQPQLEAEQIVQEFKAMRQQLEQALRGT